MSEFATGGRFRFHLAGPTDEAVLRRILRETPLPGWITLRPHPGVPVRIIRR